MATPEFISLQCDHCGGALAQIYDGQRWAHQWVVAQPNDGLELEMFINHSEAYRAGRKAGWYIAEAELCPTCAEAYAVEKSSEELL